MNYPIRWVFGIFMFVVSGCSTQSDSGGSLADDSSSDTYVAATEIVPSSDSANAVCDEAVAQLQTVAGSGIVIEQCEAQDDESGGQVFILRLNAYEEWPALFTTSKIEDVIFLVPLGLLTSSFAGANVAPTDFSSVLLVFSDANQTVYDIEPRDLEDALGSQTLEETKSSLFALSKKMKITVLADYRVQN